MDIHVHVYIQSNLHKKVIFGTKKKWFINKTDDLLKEVQFI